MNKLEAYFNKFGNSRLRLEKQLYSICQLMLTGSSQKALELLHNGISLKINKRLRTQYQYVLKDFDKVIPENIIQKESSNKIWVCWMQGMENAPIMVKKCYNSLQKNLTDRDIILLTFENIRKYTNFPDYILEKYTDGLIPHTHFSDLLCIELLCQNGGTWVDATILCTGKNIPSYMLDSELFMFQLLKPGADGNILQTSNWFMTARSHNKILLVVRELLWEYWKKNDKLIDNSLLHHFIAIASEYYADDWKRIVQYPIFFQKTLLLMLFEPFNQEKWDAVTNACPFHKLTYKFEEVDIDKKGTYYKHIMNGI